MINAATSRAAPIDAKTAPSIVKIFIGTPSVMSYGGSKERGVGRAGNIRITDHSYVGCMTRLHPVRLLLRREVLTLTTTVVVAALAIAAAGCGPGTVFDSSPSIRGVIRALI